MGSSGSTEVAGEWQRTSSAHTLPPLAREGRREGARPRARGLPLDALSLRGRAAVHPRAQPRTRDGLRIAPRAQGLPAEEDVPGIEETRACGKHGKIGRHGKQCR